MHLRRRRCGYLREKNQATSVHLVAKGALLLTGEVAANVTCKEALLSGEPLEASTQQPIDITSLTYTGCTTFFGVFACKVSATHLGSLDLLKTAKKEAELTDLEAGGKFTEVNVSCEGGGIKCTYSGSGLVGHALSAPAETNGVVEYNDDTVKNLGGSNCPANNKLDAKFVSLVPLYIKA